MRALVGICGVTELEMFFSARNIQERSRMNGIDGAAEGW